MSSTTSGREFEEYERLVQKILESKIREEYPSTVIKVFHNRKYRGQSGQEHQIDVSAELMLAGCRVLILAECKKYRASVGNEDVLTFLGRIRDIGAGKGIIVTTVGYQEGAKRLAEANGIALVLAKSEESVSWDVVMPLLFPPLIAAGAELVMRTSRKANSQLANNTPTPWTEGGTTTWSEPQRASQKYGPAGSSGTGQERLHTAVTSTAKAGAAGGAPALAQAISSEPAKITGNSPASVTARSATVSRTLRPPVDPKDLRLAEFGASLAKGHQIARTPLIHSGIFGSVWPFTPASGPLAYRPDPPLAKLATVLEELVPKGAVVDEIVSFLSKYERRGVINEFPDGLTFSLQFVPNDTVLAVGAGPVSQLYLSHIAFWIAFYGDPVGIATEFRQQSGHWRHRYPFLHWPYYWYDYDLLRPYWFERHWSAGHLSYGTLFLATSGKPKSTESYEIPWKEMIERFLAREKREIVDVKPISASFSMFLNNLYVWSRHFKVSDVSQAIESVLDKYPEMPEWEAYLRFVV